MKREIKFRAWDKDNKEMFEPVIPFGDSVYKTVVIDIEEDKSYLAKFENAEIMQSTGLKDKNGVEIYEYSELDGAYEVIFKDLRYSLRYIPNNDIIDLHDYWRDKNGEIEVTREYTKV